MDNLMNLRFSHYFIFMKEITVETKKKEEMIDITDEVLQIVEKEGTCDGMCVVFVPHTTAGVTINENADPDVRHDILLGLGSIVREEPMFRHAEGNSAAHIKALLAGSSVTVIVKDGKVMLGQWQGVYFSEFDGPRKRKVWVLVK